MILQSQWTPLKNQQEERVKDEKRNQEKVLVSVLFRNNVNCSNFNFNWTFWEAPPAEEEEDDAEEEEEAEEPKKKGKKDKKDKKGKKDDDDGMDEEEEKLISDEEMGDLGRKNCRDDNEAEACTTACEGSPDCTKQDTNMKCEEDCYKMCRYAEKWNQRKCTNHMMAHIKYYRDTKGGREPVSKGKKGKKGGGKNGGGKGGKGQQGPSRDASGGGGGGGGGLGSLLGGSGNSPSLLGGGGGNAPSLLG